VTFDMGTWPEGHSGPILNHMASCGGATCTGVDATTLDWFAIHHSGYDATAKIWPTDVLATTGAKHTITLPTDLPGGAYLLRFELIAMHSVPAQFYPWAAEIELTSSGTSLPSSEYMGKFPEMYSAAANNMALDFSLYTGNDLMSFVLPGVPVYPGGSSKGNDPRPDGSAGPAPGPAPGNATAPAPSTGSEA
ncbi:glycosyl hydrolase family 61-domain-containing protein, partial [Filobasidium floriforme]|uniref:glycosyl hydrolase family 61-domain-containing protein n=1 Tax=Filobasidium floriforme TaxID=5210 RepID=UPI001E8EAE08